VTRVTQIELDSLMIEGKYDTTYVLSALDKDGGPAWQVMDTFGTQYGGVFSDRDAAIAHACFIADASDDELNQQGN